MKEENRQFLPCIDFNRFRSIRLQVRVFVKKINKKGWKHLHGIDIVYCNGNKLALSFGTLGLLISVYFTLFSNCQNHKAKDLKKNL